jgi:hypothetical protein
VELDDARVEPLGERRHHGHLELPRRDHDLLRADRPVVEFDEVAGVLGPADRANAA